MTFCWQKIGEEIAGEEGGRVGAEAGRLFSIPVLVYLETAELYPELQMLQIVRFMTDAGYLFIRNESRQEIWIQSWPRGGN